ncbi:hypothetical protein SAMCCGM7_Ch1972 [Sinorhizobium americanum CCGM7]|nr:hypothetical protein SAMCCGM7_Ch1972 [Sinorhizobium americanum CCGM7]
MQIRGLPAFARETGPTVSGQLFEIEGGRFLFIHHPFL